MPLTVKNIVTGVVCIVAAFLLLALFQTYVTDTGLPTWLEQAIAAFVGVVAWFFISARMHR